MRREGRKENGRSSFAEKSFDAFRISLKIDGREYEALEREYRRQRPHVLCSFIYLLTCEKMSWLNRSVFVTREHLHLGYCFCTGREFGG